MAGRIGQQFGDYRLTKFLGNGSFGDVYLGEHIYEKTQAAVKVLQAKLSDKDMKEFINEASTIFRLKHPNVVQLLAFGIGKDDVPFLAMNYAPNGTLSSRHPRGTSLPLGTIIPYVAQLATALQYAHDRGLIHRDVKPENVLLGARNEVLLSDFGIAVVKHSTYSQRTENKIGTALYMAPEQWQGKPLPATDQYALGIMVYEWLCGKSPFIGDSLQLMYQHLHEPVSSLCSKVPTISSEVEQVLLKALAKDPRQRFANIQEFASTLEQVCLSQQPVNATNLFNIQMPSLPPTLKVFPSSVIVPALGTTLVTYRGHADYIHTLSWSRDGSRIASGGADTTVQIWNTVTGSTLFTYHGHTDKILSLAWATDGMRIASAGNDKTVQVRIWNEETKNSFFGHHPRNVVIYRNHPNIVSSVAWSPDGAYIASASHHSSASWSSLPQSKDWRWSFQKSREKSQEGYWPFQNDGESKTVHIWDSATGQRIRRYCNGHLFHSGVYGSFPNISRGNSYRHDNEYYLFNVNTIAWSPDGTFIASGGQDGTVEIWDVATVRLIYLYDEHQDRKERDYGWYYKYPRNVFSVAWSPNGKQIASADEDGEIHVWNAVTGEHIITCKHLSQVNAVAWSPDGTRIASGGEYGGVRIWNAATGDEIFTYRGHVGSVPVNAVAWSPDGIRIASASYNVQVWQAT